MPTASIQFSDLVKIGGPEFQGIVNGDPNLTTEWGHMVQHILADYNAGVIKDAYNQTTQASVQLMSSLSSFASSVNSGDVGKTIEASVQLVACNFTSSGAAQMVGGLANMGIKAGADAATPIIQDAAKAATGSLLSGVISGVAGAAAASGVGAAIGVGVSVVSGLLGSLFGGPPPPPYQIGSCGLNDKPKIVIKYVWNWANTVDGGPGNPNWRHFPDRANKRDAIWYAQAQNGILPHMNSSLGVYIDFAIAPPWDWIGDARGTKDTWYACFKVQSEKTKRPIDRALYDIGKDGGWQDAIEQSMWRQIEQEQLKPISGIAAKDMAKFRQFQTAYIKAWKNNREFGFNGMKMQPDWKVLEKTVAMWNQANGPQSTIRIKPVDFHLLDDDPGVAPPKTMNSFIQWILQQYNPQFSMPLASDGSFTINSGKVNDIAVGGLLPSGSVKLLAIHMAKPQPKQTIPPIVHLKKLGVAPAQIAKLQTVAAAHNIPPARKSFFFGATLAGAAGGGLVGGPVGILAGAGAGLAVDLARRHHEEKGKWL